MKFGCCIKAIEDISKVKQAGYDYFEFSGTCVAQMDDAAFQQMLQTVQELNIPCIGFNSYCNGTPAIVGPDYNPEEVAAYAKIICRRGHQLGIRSIGIGAPSARRLPEGYPPSLARQQCMEFLRITATEAEKYGIQVLFEAVHAKICDFATYTKDAVEITEQLQLPNLGIVLDFYHMHVMGEPISCGAPALPYLRHVHISTCGPQLERGYPNHSTEEVYAEILRWLKENQYDQSISIEADHFLSEAAAEAIRLLHHLDIATSK